MSYEHNGCNGCASYYAESNEFPCCICKGNVESSNPYHSLLDDLWKPAGKQAEAVNHPAHYQGKHECIDEMIALFGVEAVMHFCMCNVYKYRFRANSKNGQEDIEKADWYMGKLMELQRINERWPYDE